MKNEKYYVDYERFHQAFKAAKFLLKLDDTKYIVNIKHDRLVIEYYESIDCGEYIVSQLEKSETYYLNEMKEPFNLNELPKWKVY